MANKTPISEKHRRLINTVKGMSDKEIAAKFPSKTQRAIKKAKEKRPSGATRRGARSN